MEGRDGLHQMQAIVRAKSFGPMSHTYFKEKPQGMESLGTWSALWHQDKMTGGGRGPHNYILSNSFQRNWVFSFHIVRNWGKFPSLLNYHLIDATTTIRNICVPWCVHIDGNCQRSKSILCINQGQEHLAYRVTYWRYLPFSRREKFRIWGKL